MKTENLVNYSYESIHSFYAQGMITQCQWEAFDFIWANTHITSFPYHWNLVPEDVRLEVWKMYKVLPEKVQKVIHTAMVK